MVRYLTFTLQSGKILTILQIKKGNDQKPLKYNIWETAHQEQSMQMTDKSDVTTSVGVDLTLILAYIKLLNP